MPPPASCSLHACLSNYYSPHHFKWRSLRFLVFTSIKNYNNLCRHKVWLSVIFHAYIILNAFVVKGHGSPGASYQWARQVAVYNPSSFRCVLTHFLMSKTFGGKMMLLSNHLQHICNQQRETKNDFSFSHTMHSKHANLPLMPVGLNGRRMLLRLQHSRSNTITCCLQLGVLNSRSLLLSLSLWAHPLWLLPQTCCCCC